MTSEIPVIFLSALDEIIDKVKAFSSRWRWLYYQTVSTRRSDCSDSTQLTIQQQKYQLREQIEQHQQTAEILYQSRSLLANLLNSSQDGIAAIQAVRDPMTEEINDFHCLVVNPVFAKLLGQKRQHLMGNYRLKNLLNPTDSQTIWFSCNGCWNRRSYQASILLGKWKWSPSDLVWLNGYKICRRLFDYRPRYYLFNPFRRYLSQFNFQLNCSK